ncbi:orexin receptor type 1-like [Chelonus insularis]|uniref:orexin receptor type 1-like n=1 Tax=Chelonus insularis TaxID=460826 RepID=UPI00158EFF83|nr:orexin receptor type 1-like [Chelonus insularis]
MKKNLFTLIMTPYIDPVIVGLLLSDLLQKAVGLNDVDFVEDAASHDNSSNMTNGNSNCSNNLCINDEEYIDLIADFLRPNLYDWILITMHIIVFVCGILGNMLVCIAVYRNRSMRTVTNYFIVNLAIADLMVIIFCLPSTVLWDVYETWFLGEKLCKIIPYLQTVSVSVSILTLTSISIDRWYAICYPLEFKSTTKRAKKSILFIWLFSIIFDVPDLVVLHVVPPGHLKVETIFYTQCARSWSPMSDTIFTTIILICLYFGPLTFMTITYWKIIRVLWRSHIPGYNLPRCAAPMPLAASTLNENLEDQLASRKKAAKMLVVVVFVFAICYAPVHLLTILRQSIGLPSNDFTVTFSLLAHWMCYVNSAINPVIYNFMSGKFRKEFRRSFMCTKEMFDDRGVQKLTGIFNTPESRSQSQMRLGHQMIDDSNGNQRSTEVIPLTDISRQNTRRV